jgi:hypothetical protein
MANTTLHSQDRLSGLIGQTLNPDLHEEDLEKGDDEPEKQTPQLSHENSYEEEQRHSEEAEVSWEDDPANAHNWPKAVRIYHTAIPCKLNRCSTTSDLLLISQLRSRSWG